MQLVSIIPGFKPMNDEALLKKAEALKPELFRTPFEAPVSCCLNGKEIAFPVLQNQPLKKGDRVLLDFGCHIVGHLSLDLDGALCHQDAPAFIRVNLAEIKEELDEDPADYHGWLSSSWIQQEHCHLDLLPACLDLPRRYAFRFVQVTVMDTSPKFALLIKGAKAVGESSVRESFLPGSALADDELNRICTAAVNTLKNCSQTVLEDGPKRDRRLWIGDLRLEALASYASFKNVRLIRRCLYLFAGTRFQDGRMSACVFEKPVPEADDTYLMDYALLYPAALREYVAETGDRETLEDLYRAALDQVDWVLAHAVNDDVMNPEASGDGFIDWSDDLDRTAALQGVMICALEDAAALSALRGDDAGQKAYGERAARMRKAALKHFWSAEEGMFLSGGQASVHSQVWMILADAMPQGMAQKALDKALAGKVKMLTPYMHHYYVTALLKAGLKQQAEDHLRSYWGGMIRLGADTFWECFDPSDPLASPYGGRIVNSYCHAWSCTPVYIINRFLKEH